MLALANSTDMGLAAYVMSGDRGRAVRVAGALEAGMVGINTGRVSCAAAPFGGVKGSGYGRSGGREGIDEYLETSYIALAGGVRMLDAADGATPVEGLTEAYRARETSRAAR